MAIIQAEYANFKLVRTRNSGQFICEVDESKLQEALDRLGLPAPGKMVAICLLHKDTDSSFSRGSEAEPSEPIPAADPEQSVTITGISREMPHDYKDQSWYKHA